MWESENQDESPLMTTDNFHGIDRLVRRGCLCLSAKGLKSKVAKEDDGQTVAEVRCGADADRHRTVGRGRVASPRVIC